MSEFHAEAPQAIASERLAQGPYVVARAGVEPATLRMIGVNSTNATPHPTHYITNIFEITCILQPKHHTNLFAFDSPK